MLLLRPGHRVPVQHAGRIPAQQLLPLVLWPPQHLSALGREWHHQQADARTWQHICCCGRVERGNPGLGQQAVQQHCEPR